MKYGTPRVCPRSRRNFHHLKVALHAHAYVKDGDCKQTITEQFCVKTIRYCILSSFKRPRAFSLRGRGLALGKQHVSRIKCHASTAITYPQTKDFAVIVTQSNQPRECMSRRRQKSPRPKEYMQASTWYSDQSEHYQWCLPF